MVFFLERIARHLFEEFGEDLRDHCLVFPSRRAGLYFLKYYASMLDKPAWTPSIMTIGDFFSSFSRLSVADNEILLYELYKVYRCLNPSAESFDEFYFWGDMLINDFDDADKYLADVNALFRNVQDYKNIEKQFGDVSPEQAEIIKRFWQNFEPEKYSKEKEGFKSIWSILPALYGKFRESLSNAGLAYEGMIYREVAENFIRGTDLMQKWKFVHFVGFSALNNCETEVMRKLSASGIARFYWDYDNSYLKKGSNNSAGYFLRKNLGSFGNNMPHDWEFNTNLSGADRKIHRRIIETTSDIAQVKLIPDLIARLGSISPGDAHHTAVILADESLIVPVLTSLPSATGDINITMGYPLVMTEVYALISLLADLQRNATNDNAEILFRYEDVRKVLMDQLVSAVLSKEDKEVLEEIISGDSPRIRQSRLLVSDSTTILFRKPENPSQFSDYLRQAMLLVAGGRSSTDEDEDNSQRRLVNEYIYKVLLSVNRLDRISGSEEVVFNNNTYIRILDKILRSASVPFTGEPLSGIQIMGFLETRALDFRNIIMLSVNEGILPASGTGSSFIPYSLREAFGLPVINHQESVFAYHFYRLLHRAENVTFLYNSDSTGLRTGEMSRFLIQMRYELENKPEMLSLSFDIRTPASVETELEKNNDHLRILRSAYQDTGKALVFSPTAVNTWLACRMRFYYRYVSRLKEPDVFSGEIDHAMFGLVLHSVMKSVYSEFTGSVLSPEKLDKIISDTDRLNEFIELSLTENSKHHDMFSISGQEIIMRDILLTYILKILKTDRSLAPFTVCGLEKPASFPLDADADGTVIRIRAGGNIDRIDKKDGTVRIVDYKTGTVTDKISSISDLFEDDRKKEADGWLQTLVYCEAYLNEDPGLKIRPSIYNVKGLSADDFSDLLKIRADRKNEIVIDDYNSIRREFLEGLKVTAGKIFSSDEPFRMTETTSKCNYCPYRHLCQR